jgi:hypothetical protein
MTGARSLGMKRDPRPWRHLGLGDVLLVRKCLLLVRHRPLQPWERPWDIEP